MEKGCRNWGRKTENERQIPGEMVKIIQDGGPKNEFKIIAEVSSDKNDEKEGP